MNRRRVDYVILYVSDLHRSIAFYRDVVGLTFKFTEAGYAEFATDGTKFALYERARYVLSVRGHHGSGYELHARQRRGRGLRRNSERGRRLRRSGQTRAT